MYKLWWASHLTHYTRQMTQNKHFPAAATPIPTRNCHLYLPFPKIPCNLPSETQNYFLNKLLQKSSESKDNLSPHPLMMSLDELWTAMEKWEWGFNYRNWSFGRNGFLPGARTKRDRTVFGDNLTWLSSQR